jgi:hypothetical protein
MGGRLDDRHCRWWGSSRWRWQRRCAGRGVCTRSPSGGASGARIAIEVVYFITSLPPERADAATLLRFQRGHWQIENGLHYVRDVTFDEDRSTVRSGGAPKPSPPAAISPWRSFVAPGSPPSPRASPPLLAALTLRSASLRLQNP